LVLSVILGVSSGAAVLLFRWLVELAQTFYWRYLAIWLSQFHPYAIALVPIIGAFVVGFLHLRMQKAETGFGQLSYAVAKEGGRLPYSQIPLKTTAAALSLGAGASLGPEGPSVELGSNIGSLLGQMLKFSSDRTRLLVSAGGAAGLAAGFNAPLAGAFFALEVLLNKSFTTTKSRVNSNVSVIVIAAVVSALVAQIGMGSQPAFNLPVYELRSYWETPLYLGLGVLASFTSLIFTRTLKLVKKFFDGEFPQFAMVGKFNTLTKLAIAGICVGLVAIVFPEATGIGYATIESILQDSPFSIGLLLVLLAIKLILTAICAASGFVGGTFAPAIFLGAILGSAYGQILAVILPHSIAIAAPPAYALVGMAAVLAGSIRAPLTAVLLLFEMTRDYRIVLPLTAAVVLCVWLTEQLQPREASGYDFGAGSALDPNSILAKIKIVEIMTRSPLQFNYLMPVLPAAQILANSYFHSALIVNESHQLIGILTSQDIERILLRPNEQLRKLYVSEVCTREVLSAFADETLSDALRRMAARDLHQLPIIDRDHPGQILGIIDRQTITNAFNNVLTKQAITEKIASSKAESIVAKQMLDPLPEAIAHNLTEENESATNKSESMLDKMEVQTENRGAQLKPDRPRSVIESVPISVWKL
jgi:H+/Cl- antiporter ClcA/CBS domain-containing protein